jgi:hypothetical protein
LNGEANRVTRKHNRAIIPADVRRFGHLINKDGVLDTHRRLGRSGQRILIFNAGNEGDFDGAFESMVESSAGALFVNASPFFY